MRIEECGFKADPTFDKRLPFEAWFGYLEGHKLVTRLRNRETAVTRLGREFLGCLVEPKCALSKEC